jgi:hypothetical protein
LAGVALAAGSASDWDYGTPCRVPELITAPTCAELEPGSIDSGGETHVYVVDSVWLAGSACEAQGLGMDLDGDPQCRPDNAIGQILSTTFNFFDTDGTETGNELIAQGRMLHLIDVQATSLVDADGVGVRVLVGIDEDRSAADNFSGVEPFAVDTSAASEPMAGSISDGVLTARLGVVPLQIAIPRVDDPVITTLTATRLAMRIDGDAVEGRLAGAVSEQGVDRLLEAVWIAMAELIAEDCIDGVCEPGSSGEKILDLFDENGDGLLELSELTENALIASLVSPDLDLYDADGRFNPRTDEVKESLSVGVGFTAVPARFAVPPPSTAER